MTERVILAEVVTRRRCAECRRRLPAVGTLVRIGRDELLCSFACLARRLVREQL